MRTLVKIEKTHYYVNEESKVVVCTLECDMQLINNPAWPHIAEVMNKFIQKNPNVKWNGEFTVKAKARCCSADKFDVEKGKRLAESRAKVKMYRTAMRVYLFCKDEILKSAAVCGSYASACHSAQNDEELRVVGLSM